jgi:RNA polymerase sigma-70 factor (ECF subfamily)
MAEETPQHERFVRLFAVNEPAIRAFVRKLVPKRDDVGDVIQEVAIALWRKFDPSRGDSDFRKFAFSVAHYEVLAWRRDKARDRHILDEDVLMLLAEEAEEAADSFTAQREALRLCMEKLTEAQRKLLMAAYATKGSVQRLAQQSRRSTQGLYQWLYRMRIILLDCVRKTVQEATP